MDSSGRVSTGISGLDEIIGGLRSGENVAWQIDSLADYMYVANRFVMSIARAGKRIVYIRFGSHEEIIDADGLAAYGANVKKYELDPHVGFETFAVQVHRIISGEGKGVFFVFDCISELQKYWFSDNMVANLVCLTTPFIERQESIAYMALMYERHTYDTISRIRHSVPVLMNMRTVNGCIHILPVQIAGRYTRDMYFPLRIHGDECVSLTSSADSYAIFDKFTQTGEQRDCWDKMFDNFVVGSEDVTDEDGVPLRENIIQCLLGIEPTRLELCRKYFTTKDLIEIKKREIGTGCIGGKAAGMLLARNVIRDTLPELYRNKIEPHDSYFVGADLFYTYAVDNGIWDLRTEMIKPEDYIRLAPHGQELLMNGTFSPAIKEQFLSMLEYFGQSPIIVRSSSLLEDGFGNAFAGKYDSVFCPNQGTLSQRYEVFEQAVRQVYASTENTGAIMYRADRNLLQRDEQMALLVMRVAGDRHGKYYYPHVAGVGHSKNLYACSNSTAENKGMLRLVLGLGTRAVDREADDYARLLSMDNPTAPMKVAHGDEYRYSQHKMDVIDLENNKFTMVGASLIDKKDLKTDATLFMEKDYATESRLREDGITGVEAPEIINFSKLLKTTDFADTMTTVLRTLEEKYDYPVDIEYACNFDQNGGYKVNLLQCRPLQTRGIGSTGAGSRPDSKKYLFHISGNFMGGNVCMPVNYVVFVKVSEYLSLPEQQKYLAARSVGKLNAILKGRGAALFGPGRWGTTTPSLGVPVNFMEISNFISISEVAYNEQGLRPELSYGSHFFQDLVEAGTLYTAIYRGEHGVEFNDDMLKNQPNAYAGLTGDDGPMGDIISVWDVSDRDAVLYSEIESQECFLGFGK
jgi:pyruvate,water dikinase